MLICDNEYETKENKNWTKDEIELQHIQGCCTQESVTQRPSGFLLGSEGEY